MANKRAHVLVSGRVQGVSFRYYTVQEAESVGVEGWVRNLWDGRVEAIFEGEEDAVQHMVRWVQHGPSSAQVDSFELDWQEPVGEFDSFRVRMTASLDG
ncbi:MAG: acylphosphatase [Anaerolineales bacterium]|jgi:acylphosphatase